MKVVILAGGQRSTISNEQEGIPKPMVEIGGKPMLWHIMKGFSFFGLNEFIICGGYKVDMIKEYFMDYYIYQSDITVDLRKNTVEIHKNRTEDWKVTVVDTGLYSDTGRRIAMIQKYVEDDEFMITHGDCLSDIDVAGMLKEHHESDKIVTMAVARPTGRNRVVKMAENGLVSGDAFENEMADAWTDTGLYVAKRKIFDYLSANYSLEQLLTGELAAKGELVTYKHYGFWAPVETFRDRVTMENFWNAGMAPWIRKSELL